MYDARKAMFLYCVSPVHMGAGTSVGAIDSPIQRERHTHHPMMAGSGLKGALRHHLAQSGSAPWLPDVFGSDHDPRALKAGAISISDAQLVLFPVRSAEKAYLYVTSPVAVGRLLRLLHMAGVEEPKGLEGLQRLALAPGECVAAAAGLPRVIVDAFVLTQVGGEESRQAVASLGGWLAANAIPSDPGFRFFADKIGTDLVLINEENFGFFVRNATSVEPHVAIDEWTGTAEDGKLFYVENLPPESLLVSLVLAGPERVPAGERQDGLTDGASVLGQVTKALEGRMVQIGGDATTGRGQVFARFC